MPVKLRVMNGAGLVGGDFRQLRVFEPADSATCLQPIRDLVVCGGLRPAGRGRAVGQFRDGAPPNRSRPAG